MRYLPKSPAEREHMLREIGVASIDELFAHIPAQFRLNRDLAIPPQMAESEIVDWFRARAAENGNGYGIMLGAGAYNHYRPVRHRCAHLARRVVHRLHALSAGDRAGHSAGHL